MSLERIPESTVVKCEARIREMEYIPVYSEGSKRWGAMAAPNNNYDPREVVFLGGRLQQYMRQQIRAGRWDGQPRLIRRDTSDGLHSVNTHEK